MTAVRSIDDVAPAGVGMVVFTRELADAVDRSLLDVVEVEPQVYWKRPGDAAQPVRADEDLPAYVASLGVKTLLHSVGLPVANAVAPPAHDLERLARDAEILDPLWVSEHLSFDRAEVGGETRWTGFLLPPPQTRAAVRVAAARLCALRDALQRPVAFETGTNYFEGDRDELADGAFFAAVAEAADCGILLDLHNLWANERNGRASLEQVVDALPLDRVWELHLAGGQMHRGVYLDAHHGLVDPELIAIAARVVPRLPALRAIVLEAIPDSLREVAPEALRAQLEALRDLWSRRGTTARATRRSVRIAEPDVLPDDVRELARHADSVAAALADAQVARDGDRIALVAELVRQARGSTLLRVVPLTSRLLMAEIGVEPFTALFERYAAAHAPQRFPTVEAEGFLAFVEREALDVPYLGAVVQLERAVVESISTATARVVRFPVAPGPLFSALRERQRPPLLPPAPHAVRVGPAGVRIRRMRARLSPAAEPPVRVRPAAGGVRRRSTAEALRGTASA